MLTAPWLHVQVQQAHHHQHVGAEKLEEVSSSEPALNDRQQKHRPNRPLPPQPSQGPRMVQARHPHQLVSGPIRTIRLGTPPNLQRCRQGPKKRQCLHLNGDKCPWKMPKPGCTVPIGRKFQHRRDEPGQHDWAYSAHPVLGERRPDENDRQQVQNVL